MKNKIILVSLIILYYISLYCCFFLLLTYAFFIYPILMILFNLIFPFLLMILLPVLKYIFKKNWRKSIQYSFILLGTYTVLSSVVGQTIDGNLKIFSTTKWQDQNYCDVRYMMIPDLQKNYQFIDMPKKDLYALLGNPNNKTCGYDYEKDKKICYITLYGDLNSKFLCFFFNENNTIIEVKEEEIY